MANAEKKSEYPKTLWASSPTVRTRILIPGPNGKDIVNKLRFHEGHVTVSDANEEAVVRRVMRNRVWEQDLDEPEVDKRNAWVCYSSKAFIAYMRNLPAHNDPIRR